MEKHMRLRSFVAAALAAVLAAAGTLAPAAPAAAATADSWGFAYVRDSTVSAWTVLDTSWQWGSWKMTFPTYWADGIKLAPGQFRVRFPQVAGKGAGVPHVTAASRMGHYCEVIHWFRSGADQIVDVQCHKPGGWPEDTEFSVLWTASSGKVSDATSHAYVEWNGGVGESYNSMDQENKVEPVGVGQYEVRLAGMAHGLFAGNVQVTAVQPNAAPRRCKVDGWTTDGDDVLVKVFCYDQDGVLTDSDFVLSYHRQRPVIGSLGPPWYFGYLDTAAGGPTNYHSLFGVGANTVVDNYGSYMAIFPQIGFLETHAQVVAHGDGSNYCNLSPPWMPTDRVTVICFDNDGVITPHRFLATFTSRV
jgi:hypothetical protein